jgi:tetratricopeptide (TPR) repeat protein
MNNHFITVLLLFSVLTFGQKKSSNEDLILFEKTVAIQDLIYDELRYIINPKDTLDSTNEEKIRRNFAIEIKAKVLQQVIQDYEELIKEFPKSKLVFRALNNKGFAELELKDYEKAKETFLKILNSEANDKEKGGIGSGIMGEPYSNYKNRASKTLADLEYQNGNYQEALKFLDETKKFPYRHFCGNEYAADEIYMTEMYAKCYLGLKQNEKAYDILLPNILENGLASNSELIKITINSLLKDYKKEDLKIQFENCFKNVRSEKEKRNKNDYTNFYIIFLNRKIQLDSWQVNYVMTEEEREREYDQILGTSEFYKSLLK